MGLGRKVRARMDIVTAKSTKKVRRCQGWYWERQRGEAWKAQAVGWDI